LNDFVHLFCSIRHASHELDNCQLHTVYHFHPLISALSPSPSLYQDLPDVEGDKLYNVSTFASEYGVVRTAAGASTLLCLAYLTAIALPFAPFLRNSFNKVAMVWGHSLYLLYFLSSYSELDAENTTSLKRFYKAIWNLFYLEYCLYPFI
jgi:homogentisate solanesyltransferase